MKKTKSITNHMSRNSFVIQPWPWIISLIIIGVLCENIKIFDVMGAPFKLDHIIFLLAIIVTGIHIKLKRLFAGILLIVLPCLCLYRIGDKGEWLKSYIGYLFLVTFLIFVFPKFLREFKRNHTYYLRLLLKTIAFAQILGVIQFFCMNLFNVFFLQDVFGVFQFHKNVFDMTNGLYRTFSVYHEPSFFGLVTITSITTLFVAERTILTRREFAFFGILNLLSVFISLSASCMLIALTLLFFYQFIMRKNILIKVLFMLVVAGGIVGMAYFTQVLAPVQRIHEIGIENSSGYERITSQWLYVKKTLQYYPLLGRGIGQEGNVDAVGIVGLYSAMHNSLAGVIVHFGLSALLFVLPLISLLAGKLKSNPLWGLITVAILGIYVSTGAYLSVDTFCMVILLVAVGNSCLDQRIGPSFDQQEIL